ncbi:alcohol dehydrogenase superfamily protein [Cylindrobasidium torrendii FP15055 ss-10]|uniref:Alcohol dehydrogenase superfamily protein n=1 Tax=Cylindrobasidium torrendii FP15055 ss-10 TaxID=1314674 RepID=A0A0D7AZT4_9AGAR|nr:alcohol dehydrogenase superfamily protein [Cylindrobasidium torrendii FP15055 ss-10]
MSLPTQTTQYHFPQRGSIYNLKQRVVPLPKLKPTEVLVKTHAVSLQYRDLMIADKTYGSASIQTPDELVPCSDMSGEVLAVGEAVEQWEVGDRVCANFTLDHVYGDINPQAGLTALGGYAHGVLTKYRTFPAHSLVAIPAHLSYEEAATLPCAALTAWNALHGPVSVKAGDTVLVLGTGGVSIFGLQFAAAAGATVIATSSSNAKLQIAKRLGATHVINYTTHPNWEKEVSRLTGGRGVDHVLEVGGPGTLERSMKAVRYGGSIHLIGFLAQTKATLASIVGRAVFRNVTLRGIIVGSVASFHEMNRMLEANPECTRPVIDKVFAFDDAVKAYEHLRSQKHVGKIVIRVAESTLSTKL